jgi:hypothetical protein
MAIFNSFLYVYQRVYCGKEKQNARVAVAASSPIGVARVAAASPSWSSTFTMLELIIYIYDFI